MSKLSETQLIVLSKAARRDDGAAVLPDRMNRAAAAKVGASLVARKLMREVRAKPGMPVWRIDENDRSLSLVLLRAGRDAIGVEDDKPEVDFVEEAGKGPGDKAGQRSPAKAASGEPIVKTPRERGSKLALAPATGESLTDASNANPRAGTKQALVIGMLSKDAGVTLDALVEATGWLPHTTRAAMTGLRKRGFIIERFRDETLGSLYRIVGQPQASMGA